MPPLIPTDPTLLVSSLDRSDPTLPAVLLGYVLLTLLLLARGVKRSWLGDGDPGAHAECDDESDANPDEPLAESPNEASP